MTTGKLIRFILLYTLLLTGLTLPDGLASVPVRNAPPWPLGCRWTMTGTPCGLLY